MSTPGLNSILDRAVREQRPRVVMMSYDLGRRFEDFREKPNDDLGWPDLLDFSVDDPRIRLSGSGWGMKSVDSKLRFELTTVAAPESMAMSKATYIKTIERALAYIAAGDIYQVNIANRLHVRTARSADEVFERLIAVSPGAFSCRVDWGDRQLICNSPELFLEIDLKSGRIENRPIKGTRPNAAGMYADLLHSEKDQAELAMIVDLQRNDLGRVCETGSVVVTQPRVIETHATVLHGVATVEGQLRKDVTLDDIIQATFPCGSITGCPKIRAMQIIDELEPVSRGPYCGAVGVVHPNGRVVLNVAIRSMVLTAGVAHVYVGGGIVADSTPMGEWEETLTKARAMLLALG
jgi:para-aminobenzoate synthetase component I